MPSALSKDPDVSKQFLGLLKTMWQAVDNHFDAAGVLSPEGHALVQTYAIKSAHPELPYALHFLAMMCALSNGAKSEWFPNAPSTLFMMVLNLNYAQTRKSSITGNGDAFGDLLDKHVSTIVGRAFEEAVRASGAIAGGPPEAAGGSKGKPTVTSSVMHAATPEEFFHRCAGDYQQVQNADHKCLDGFAKRFFFGVLVNLDEDYDMLNAFGLLSDSGKTSSRCSTGGAVNPHQSAFNKLAQYGQASRATKTAGSYGATAAPTVSVGISGNIHPSMYVPMERGEIGSHHVCAKERMLVGTGRVVQPHAALPSDYQVPEGHCGWKWVPLTEPVAKILGLDDLVGDPEAAQTKLKRVEEQTGDDAGPIEISPGLFVPDASGYHVDLPDGVPTQLRFVRDPSVPSGFTTEWRVANRTFPTPLAHQLEVCVPRVTGYFAKAHMRIDPDADALALHQSYQASGADCMDTARGSQGPCGGCVRLGAIGAPWAPYLGFG